MSILTDDEIAFEGVTHDRFMEIVNRDDVSVISTEIGINTFGDFLFVSLVIEECVYVFYGAGYNNLRESWVYNYWHLSKSPLFPYPTGNQPQNKEQAIGIINNNVKYAISQSKSSHSIDWVFNNKQEEY